MIEGGGVAYLRVINPSGGGSLQIRLSDTPTSEPNDPGPAFVDSLLILEDAFTFDSDGNAGSIVLKGPNHPDNSFQDPTEPYFWTPDNGVAFIAWSNAARTQNVTLTLNGGVIGTFIDIEVSIETPVPEVSINPVSYVPVYNDLQVDITTPDPNTVVALSSFVATVHDIVVNIETPAPEAIILLYVLAFGDLRVRVETPVPEANIILESVQHRILIVDIETPVPEVDIELDLVTVEMEELNIDSISIVNRRVIIMLSDSVLSGDKILLNYEVPQNNPVQNLTMDTATSITDLELVNNT